MRSIAYRAYLNLALETFTPSSYAKYIKQKLLKRLSNDLEKHGLYVVPISRLSWYLGDATGRPWRTVNMRLIRLFDKGTLLGNRIYIRKLKEDRWKSTEILGGFALPLIRNAWIPKLWSRIIIVSDISTDSPKPQPNSWFHTEKGRILKLPPYIRPSWIRVSRVLGYRVVVPTGPLKGLSIIALKPTQNRPFIRYLWGFIARNRHTHLPNGFWLGLHRSWIPKPRSTPPPWSHKLTKQSQNATINLQKDQEEVREDALPVHLRNDVRLPDQTHPTP